MPKIMFGWRTPEGEWTYTPPARPPGPEATAPAPKPKKAWRPQGCFLQKRMSGRERQLRAGNARAWLEWALHDGPLPAAEILRRAKIENVPERGLRRAKRFLGVRSTKRGGYKGHYGSQWFWEWPREAQEER